MNKYWQIIISVIIVLLIGLAIYNFPNLMIHKYNVSDIIDSTFDEIWLIDKSAYEFYNSDTSLYLNVFPDFFKNSSSWQNYFKKIYIINDNDKIYWILYANIDYKKNKIIKWFEQLNFKKIKNKYYQNLNDEILYLKYFPYVLYAKDEKSLPIGEGYDKYSDEYFTLNSNYNLHLALNTSKLKFINKKWAQWGIKFLTDIEQIYYFDINNQDDLWIFYQKFPKEHLISSSEYDFDLSIIPANMEQFFVISKISDQPLSNALQPYIIKSLNNHIFFDNVDFSNMIKPHVLVGIIDQNPLLIMQCKDTTNIINQLNNKSELISKNTWMCTENIFNNTKKSSHSLSYLFIKDTLLFYFEEIKLLELLNKSYFPITQKEFYKKISAYLRSEINELAFFNCFSPPFSFYKNKDLQGQLWMINNNDLTTQKIFIWIEKIKNSQSNNKIILYNKICKQCKDPKLIYSPSNVYITYIQDKKIFIEGLITKSFVEIDLPDKNIIDALVMDDGKEHLLLVSPSGLFMYDMAGNLKWKKQANILGCALFKYEDGLQRLFYLSNDGILHNLNSDGNTPEGWKLIKTSNNSRVAYAKWNNKEYICVADNNNLTLYNRRGDKQAHYKFNTPLKDLHFSQKNEILYLIDIQGKIYELREAKQGSLVGKPTGFNNFTLIGDTLVMWDKYNIAWIDKDNGKLVRDFKYQGNIIAKDNNLSWIKKTSPLIIKDHDNTFTILSAKMKILDTLSHIESIDALYWNNSYLLLTKTDGVIETIKR